MSTLFFLASLDRKSEPKIHFTVAHWKRWCAHLETPLEEFLTAGNKEKWGGSRFLRVKFKIILLHSKNL